MFAAARRGRRMVMKVRPWESGRDNLTLVTCSYLRSVSTVRSVLPHQMVLEDLFLFVSYMAKPTRTKIACR